MKTFAKGPVILLISVLVLAACSSSSDGESLVGPKWVLTGLNGDAPLPDTTIFIVFNEDGTISSSDGCNSMGRPYTVDGDNISFGALGPMTLMACSESIEAQATAFQAVLTNAITFAVDGDELTLSAANGDVLATFQAQS